MTELEKKQLPRTSVSTALQQHARQLSTSTYEGAMAGLVASFDPSLRRRILTTIPSLQGISGRTAPSIATLSAQDCAEKLTTFVLSRAPESQVLTQSQQTILLSLIGEAAKDWLAHPRRKLASVAAPILTELEEMQREIVRDRPTTGLGQNRSFSSIVNGITKQQKIAQNNGEDRALVVLVTYSAPSPDFRNSELKKIIGATDKLQKVWTHLKDTGLDPCIAQVTVNRWPVGSGMTSFGFEYHIAIPLRENR